MGQANEDVTELFYTAPRIHDQGGKEGKKKTQGLEGLHFAPSMLLARTAFSSARIHATLKGRNRVLQVVTMAEPSPTSRDDLFWPPGRRTHGSEELLSVYFSVLHYSFYFDRP